MLRFLANKRISLFIIICIIFSLFSLSFQRVYAAESSRYFPDTDKTVSGKFLDYWNNNGGLPVYGYPITNAQVEIDPETNKSFLIQWFERARFELHPEFAGTRFEVLLGLLGKDLRREALAVDPDFFPAGKIFDPSRPKEQQWYLPETGHNLRFGFLQYWLDNGGLERFGYPISEEHPETDPETGKVYISQWFERARFEYHPENKAPYDILLGLLGNQIKAPKTKAEFMWKIGGGFNRFFSPGGIAVDTQDNVYITDQLSKRVFKYDSIGLIQAKWGLEGDHNGQFNAVAAIAADQKGNIFVPAIGSSTIAKFDSFGNFLLKWTDLGTGTPVSYDLSGQAGIATDSLGNVYVADSIGNSILKFDGNGKFLLKWGTYGSGNGQLNMPWSLAIDKQDRVYVAEIYNHRVQKFDNNGLYLSKLDLESRPFDRTNSAYSLAVSQVGELYIADGATNRILKYDDKGQLLKSWGAQGGQNGQFNAPTGIALDSKGNVYVSDLYNYRVQKFDSNGNFLLKWGNALNGDGQFNPDFIGGPTGIAVNRQGNIYVGDAGNHSIQKFDYAGRFLFSFGSKGTGAGQFDYDPGTPCTRLSIAIDPLGYIYVADCGNYRIQKFDSAGNFLLMWGKQGTADGEFGGIIYPGGPYGIAVDSKGNVYVADRGNARIQVFDSNGHFLYKWGNAGLQNGEFAYPYSISIDSADNVFVTDDLRIQKFDSKGHFLTKFGNGGNSITVDSKGNLYVAGTSNGRIWKFDNDGHFLLDWGSEGSADGQFSLPEAIAVDNFDNAYIADTRNNRIQKFSLH
ncbi:MAG: SBBP repeat-containing protein [Chloroflexi bacterium]|uniref:SBBP repeat-containing protein n=1 Tax=Candidatus Chlorohelix allophototropha TaxID=3003348 RepID=A0A8T7LZR8_9CHLR|nr:SBBP repeat-containing protein [Chloroflexota bacterium]WJW67687.1 SBBP repeat-containing protein [Chloroflexota bacterium L227-S17]